MPTSAWHIVGASGTFVESVNCTNSGDHSLSLLRATCSTDFSCKPHKRGRIFCFHLTAEEPEARDTVGGLPPSHTVGTAAKGLNSGLSA